MTTNTRNLSINIDNNYITGPEMEGAREAQEMVKLLQDIRNQTKAYHPQNETHQEGGCTNYQN
jgi:hypothetical protein